ADLGLQEPDRRRHVGVQVVAVQRQVADADLGESQAGRGEFGQLSGQAPVDRIAGQAADDAADLSGHRVLFPALAVPGFPGSPSSVPTLAGNRKCRPEMRLCFSRMTDLDLRQLRVFVAVAEECSFTHAAARLRLTQPAVSRTVASLERSVGVALLRRSTHGCALTPAGQVLLAEARKLLESAGRAARLAQRAAAPSPQLIVAAKPDSDAGLLPAMLDRYQRDPGRPPAGLLFQDTHELAPALRSGRADVALIVGPADCEGLD